MSKKPKRDSATTTAPTEGAPDVVVWASPEFQKTADLAAKLLKVPKDEVDEMEAERPKRHRKS